jgi:hypothetical protein
MTRSSISSRESLFQEAEKPTAESSDGPFVITSREDYKAIPDMGVHQVAGPLKLFRLQVRTVFKNIPRPLIVNGIGPFGAVKVRDRDMH